LLYRRASKYGASSSRIGNKRDCRTKTYETSALGRVANRYGMNSQRSSKDYRTKTHETSVLGRVTNRYGMNSGRSSKEVLFRENRHYPPADSSFLLSLPSSSGHSLKKRSTYISYSFYVAGQRKSRSGLSLVLI
jgi:hypothetical protein